MIGGWIINATIRFSSNGVAAMGQLGAATMRANAVLDTHTSKVKRMTAALEQYRTKALQVGQHVSGALALGGAAISAYGLYGAAQLQKTLTAVQIATNSNSQASMQRFAALAFRTSGITAQGVNTIGEEMAVAATSGLNDPNKLADAFTRIAKAADVLWIARGTNPVDSVRQMSMLAHLFGAYSGGPLQHMLDRATQMQFVQPEALRNFTTQGRYFIPTALAAGVSEEDIFKQAMTMGQTGYLRTRGGASLRRIIQYLAGGAVMTGSLSKKQHAAMSDLGLMGPGGTLRPEYLDHGKLQLQKVIDHLEAIRKNFTPVAFTGELQRAFLAQGGSYMAAVLRPQVYQKAHQNWEMMNAIGSVDTLWGRYRHDIFYEWGVFWTNLVNIPKAMFFPLLKDLDPLLKSWGDGLGKIVMGLAEHPDVAKNWAKGILAFTVVMGGAWLAFTAALGVSAIAAPFAMWRLRVALNKLTQNVSKNATILDVEAGTTGGAMGKIGGFFKKIGGAAAGLAIALAPFAAVLAGIAGQVVFFKTFMDIPSNIKQMEDEWSKLHGGADVNTAGAKSARAFLRAHHIRPGHHGSGGGFGPNVTHIGKVEIHIDGSKSPHETAKSVAMVLDNPRSAIAVGGATRTHTNIPFALTTVPV